MPDKYLCSIREAAETLGIGRTKLYDLLAKGHLSSVQIGTRRLVRVESIRLMLDAAGEAA